MTDPLGCITCAAIRQLCDDECERRHKHRRGSPNPAEDGRRVCPACLQALGALPRDIAEAHALLEADDLDVPGTGSKGDGRSKNPEAPLPFVAEPADLLAPWATPQGPIRRGRLAAYAGDQVGHMPVRDTLRWRIRDVLSWRDVGEVGPESVVADMCRWLEIRADWLADSYGPVDEYAAELVYLRRVLFGLVGQPTPDERPKPLSGVPCPRCRRVALVRLADGRTECTWEDCRSIFDEADYGRITKAVTAAIRRGDIGREEVAS